MVALLVLACSPQPPPSPAFGCVQSTQVVPLQSLDSVAPALSERLGTTPSSLVLKAHEPGPVQQLSVTFEMDSVQTIHSEWSGTDCPLEDWIAYIPTELQISQAALAASVARVSAAQGLSSLTEVAVDYDLELALGDALSESRPDLEVLASVNSPRFQIRGGPETYSVSVFQDLWTTDSYLHTVVLELGDFSELGE